jgi:ATP-dependent DNA helicase RecQ
MKQDALRLLRIALNDPETVFHPGQWDAIEALVERRERLLVVQRTGWGKSVIYFLATRLLRDRDAGCTLLISPLLALMRNQIQAAQRIGVRAATINSTNPEDWADVRRELQAGRVDILLISPERLANDDFLQNYLLPIAVGIGLFVVDEAHCISDWGHDFRPDYRRILRILQALPPNMPMLATTATANDRVVRDIEGQLGPRLKTLRGPLARESLRLQNLRIPSQASRMAWLAHKIPELPGSGIVYTLTVRDACRLAEWLRSRGIVAEAYYGSLDNEQREALEDKLLRNEVKALVATVALGMGFDKPDLGFVIHFQRPASVVHYYQQVGRAGRALPNAYGVLLSGAEDDDITDFFIRTAFPTAEEVQQVLDALRRGPLKQNQLEAAVNLSHGKVEKVLKFLSLESPSPITRTPNGYARTPVQWTMPLEMIERITGVRRREQERMREYMASRRCLMQFLAEELNDPAAAPCGKCAVCHAGGLSADFPRQLADAASQFLNNLDVPIDPRKQWPIGIEFESQRGKLPKERQAEPGRALCRWGDPGLGELVRTGKQRTGRFSDELVQAAVRLIRDRWNPQPPPAWVTCVPSFRHPDLVPDFARRLAAVLRLPFAACMQKIRDTEPQKTGQNSHQQVGNLENVFQVDRGQIYMGPVLLVDDMVDSRWTMTVLAYKLRESGSGPVFPFALADSSAGDGD